MITNLQSAYQQDSQVKQLWWDRKVFLSSFNCRNWDAFHFYCKLQWKKSPSAEKLRERREKLGMPFSEYEFNLKIQIWCCDMNGSIVNVQLPVQSSFKDNIKIVGEWHNGIWRKMYSEKYLLNAGDVSEKILISIQFSSSPL